MRGTKPGCKWARSLRKQTFLFVFFPNSRAARGAGRRHLGEGTLTAKGPAEPVFCLVHQKSRGKSQNPHARPTPMSQLGLWGGDPSPRQTVAGAAEDMVVAPAWAPVKRPQQRWEVSGAVGAGVVPLRHGRVGTGSSGLPQHGGLTGPKQLPSCHVLWGCRGCLWVGGPGS